MENFKTADIFKLVIPHWKKLLTVALISLGLGYGITFLLKPLYKSYAIVYPVNLSPSSEESNTEQLLQWFNSEEVKKNVAKKFDLYKHYNISLDDPKHETYFNLKYKELVSISATLYESIEITVKDQEPEMAQKIVQGIIDETNALISSVRKERLKEYIENNEKEYFKESVALDSIQKIVLNIRLENNIVDFGAQAKALAKKMTKGQLNDSENKTWNALKTKETEINRQSTVLASQMGTYNYFRNEVNKFNYEYNSNISYTNVVSKPTLPDAKCYPIRSLIAVIISISTVLLAFIYIVVTNYKNQKVD